MGRTARRAPNEACGADERDVALTERATGTVSPAAALDRTVDEVEATRVLRRAAWLVGLVWLPLVVVWSGLPFALTFDDSYYYAEIARNLAHGGGSTFDGINLTNGYHPLWLGLSIPVFLVGLDGVAAIRALLVLQLAMWVGTLWVVAGIAGRRLGGAPRPVVAVVGGVLALTGGNPFVLKMVVNGLESAPAVLIAVLLLARVDRRYGRVLDGTARTRLINGGLLGLAFLARTDAALLIVCVAAWAVVEARGVAGGRAHGATKALAELLVIPSLTVFAYASINLAWFGHLSQVSGDVKRVPLAPGRALLLVLVGAAAVGLMARLGRPPDPERAPRFWRVAGFTRHTAWYPAFLVLLGGYYLILSSQVWLWYFAPVGLYACVLLTLVAADLADGARLETPEKAPHRAVLPIAAILAVPLLAALVVQGRSFADPHLRSIQEANREAGGWISTHVPPGTVLGSWDAGVVGYFTDQPVMNLDGVVNSFAYLEASEAGTQGEFLRDRDLAYVVNHGPLVDGEDPEIHEAVTHLLGEDADDDLVQEHRVEFTYRGTTTGSGGSASTDEMAVFLYRLLR